MILDINVANTKHFASDVIDTINCTFLNKINNVGINNENFNNIYNQLKLWNINNGVNCNSLLQAIHRSFGISIDDNSKNNSIDGKSVIRNYLKLEITEYASINLIASTTHSAYISSNIIINMSNKSTQIVFTDSEQTMQSFDTKIVSPNTNINDTNRTNVKKDELALEIISEKRCSIYTITIN